MTTKQFENWLAEAIEAQRGEVDDDPIRHFETFEEAGVLTTDRGLVIRFEDRSEIQLTLVLSRRGTNDEED